MKVIAFGASSSTQSINKKLATYAVSFLADADVEVLDLNDFEMPLFSQDRENQIGHHPLAQQFRDKIAGADALVISFTEHNGSYSAAYKNVFDWASRIPGKVYAGKPVVLLSTSPGPRGAGSVLAAATASMPFFGATVKASLSVPVFHEKFDAVQGVLKDEEWQHKVRDAVLTLLG